MLNIDQFTHGWPILDSLQKIIPEHAAPLLLETNRKQVWKYLQKSKYLNVYHNMFVKLLYLAIFYTFREYLVFLT